jgi:hypothetical protein
MLVYANTNVGEVEKGAPQLDRRATLQLASTLFPKEELEPIGDGDLSYTCPPDDELHIGCFPGISILAAKEFGIDNPSKLPVRFISAGGSGTVYLHAMHSVVDWFAFAQWIPLVVDGEHCVAPPQSRHRLRSYSPCRAFSRG